MMPVIRGATLKAATAVALVLSLAACGISVVPSAAPSTTPAPRSAAVPSPSPIPSLAEPSPSAAAPSPSAIAEASAWPPWDDPHYVAERQRAHAMLDLWAQAAESSSPDSISIRGELPKEPGDGIDKAYGDAESVDLTFTFLTGEYCGPPPIFVGEAIESDLAVVIIVHAQIPEPAADATPRLCAPLLVERSAVAQLSEPLGQRVLLDLQNGRRVPVLDEPPPSIQLH